MKKLNNLSESNFLKLFFGFITLAFAVGAVCLPDRNTMFSGLMTIITNPCKISTSYFQLAGYSATFLNVALVCLICLGLYCITGAKANNVSTLAFLLTAGFSSWGINVFNVWPTFLGVALYCLVKKEKLGANVNAMLFSTGIAPLVSEMLWRYPGTEVGFSWAGLGLFLAVGFAIGFFLPAGLPHAPKVHKGFDLYSAALPIGMAAFFLQALLYKTQGVDLPAAPAADTLKVASTMTANIFCGSVFGVCVLLALLMGCTPKDYWKLLRDKEGAASYSETYGNATFLMNVGIYGLFILGYYNLVGATFNAVTFGLVFCMLACCNSGSQPLTVLPIMLGYVAASYLFSWTSGLAGGDFGGDINAQAILVGLCYANGLSPISRKYGWRYSFLAAVMHYVLVTSVPTLHGGYCLYNGGFTAALICLILIPVLEKFCRTKEEKKLAKSKA